MSTEIDSMWRALIILVPYLAIGCTSPTPTYFAAIKTDVTVDGSRFRVYHFPGSGNVEAHRISFRILRSRSRSGAEAVQAIETATGCYVRPGSIHGDPAIVRGKVDCFTGSLF